MKLTKLRIRNFRSLVDITLPLADTTVLLGENNVGKSAILEAIRHVLSRARTGRSSRFDEYDFHMADESADPRESDGIVIDVVFQERAAGEWDANVRDALERVVQLELGTETYWIHLRLSARFDTQTKSFVSNPEFLNANEEPLKLNHGLYLTYLLRYVPLFRLGAVRDPAEELSGRSRFWRPILKALDLPGDKLQAIQEQMDALNQELLTLDPRLDDVTKTLGRAGDVVSTGTGGTGDRVLVRALPLQSWDLLARSDIAVRGKGSNVAFPLLRHGQGLQSLAVLFLFEAFVGHLLKAAYEAESTPVLTLEEPEAHLHPQAARAVWRQIERLPGQQIITTHSPYFAQLVPIHDIRILRRRGSETSVHWLPRTAEVQVRYDDKLKELAERRSDVYGYRSGNDPANDTLIAKRCLTKEEWRDLASTCPDQVKSFCELRSRAAVLLDDTDLHDIEQYMRRTRGEIFFARCWLLCEGQSEIILLPRFAELLGIDLDACGIALIDYQNNGSPGAFAAVARALDIPWLMLCDDDDGGNDHIAQIEKRGFDADERAQRIERLPGTDLEGLLAQHFTDELHEIATPAPGQSNSANPGDAGFVETLAAQLRRKKTTAARQLAVQLEESRHADRIPEPIRGILKQCQEIANA